MSSLQKFHRRTNNAPVVKLIGSEAPVAGAGFYLGFAGDGTSYMYVAPKSTEASSLAWGSYGTVRGTVSTTDGLANTNTLAGFGQAAHPPAYAAKNLTTGGYNTWYLPAIAELTTLYSNKAATPFSTANSFGNYYYWSSTELSGNYAKRYNFTNGTINNNNKNTPSVIRAIRRLVI
jgi:hypothetical protein